MAMSEEHKAALAQGRRESRMVKGYLEALGSRRPGRPITRESLQRKLDNLDGKIAVEEDPLRKVELIQQRIEAEQALSAVSESADVAVFEAGFIEVAKSYSERKGISYSAWRQIGVPADVLRKAGVPRTRRT
ncbi:MAG: hypothetical protein GWP04_08850 [Gammaproteobacteria bacterium]|nr:hypothetical protein [Gammaproteobacteria bacterium]